MYYAFPISVKQGDALFPQIFFSFDLEITIRKVQKNQ
jgi:hypothetical protein